MFASLFLDTDLRNIIDKLAQFVARNGPEFEQMTKSKQKGNPKFQFLYGGEFFNYYQYKVTTEQASKFLFWVYFLGILNFRLVKKNISNLTKST